MSNKRVEEELQHDVLLDTFSRAQSFYDANRSAIIGSAVAVIVAIAAGIGYYYYSQSQENKAEQLMGSATEFYLKSDFKKALKGSDEDFTVGFEQIINNYSGTKAANLAHYYASVCEYNLGDTQKALSYIEDYEVPEGILGVGPLSFKGVLLTDLGNLKQAGDTYVKAAEWDENESTTPFNYLQAAQVFHDAKQNKKAQKYAQKVIDEYSNSAQADAANKLLGSLAVAH